MYWELAPKVVPRRLGLLTPKLAIFYRISEERGRFQGPLETQNFHPPLWTLREPQQKNRCVFAENPLLKTPISWFLRMSFCTYAVLTSCNFRRSIRIRAHLTKTGDRNLKFGTTVSTVYVEVWFWIFSSGFPLVSRLFVDNQVKKSTQNPGESKEEDCSWRTTRKLLLSAKKQSKCHGTLSRPIFFLQAPTRFPQKSGKPPGLETSQLSFSQNFGNRCFFLFLKLASRQSRGWDHPKQPRPREVFTVKWFVETFRCCAVLGGLFGESASLVCFSSYLIEYFRGGHREGGV